MEVHILSGTTKGQTVEAGEDQDVFIGRQDDCLIHIEDAKASRRHARIFAKDDSVFLEDLDSKNGTTLNGRKILRARLTNGDEILIGSTLMTVTGLATRSPAWTAVDLYEGESSILVSMPQKDANLLTAVLPSASLDEVLHENRLLREVCVISQEIAAGGNSDTTLATILDTLQAGLNADTACVLVRHEPEHDWQTLAASQSPECTEPVRVSQTIIHQAIREGVAILSSDARQDERFAASESILSYGITSVLCCPLRIQDAWRGVLCLDRREREEPFDEMDLRLAATVANILGLFLTKEALEIENRNKARLAAIGETIAGLAHYAKNIIASLRFGVSSLRSVVRQNRLEHIDRCVQSISREEKRLSNLVLDMLSYAREREPERTSVDLSQLVESVSEPYRQALGERQIAFHVEIRPGTPSVRAEETSLHRVFLNLLLNAMDALEEKEGGDAKSISISIAPLPEEDAVEARFRDSGSGIPRDRLPHVFDLFYSTKGSRGTGLGLAVVRKIMEEHGGSIEVDSCPGEWTEFRIVLPVTGDSGSGSA